jgi:hypothetical protein
VNLRRARIVATLLLVLLGATLLGEARAQACAPACCCPALEHADGDCAALATSCCHADAGPVAPSASVSAPSPAAAPAPEMFAIPGAKPRGARLFLAFDGADRRPSPLRFSVVLRI